MPQVRHNISSGCLLSLRVKNSIRDFYWLTKVIKSPDNGQMLDGLLLMIVDDLAHPTCGHIEYITDLLLCEVFERI